MSQETMVVGGAVLAEQLEGKTLDELARIAMKEVVRVFNSELTHDQDAIIEAFNRRYRLLETRVDCGERIYLSPVRRTPGCISNLRVCLVERYRREKAERAAKHAQLIADHEASRDRIEREGAFSWNLTAYLKQPGVPDLFSQSSPLTANR